MNPADVCLIVEGGYPYVLGGVASWVDTLVRSLPEIRFNVVAIRNAAQNTTLVYELPANVEAVYDIVLDEYVSEPWTIRSRTVARQKVFDCYQAVLSGTDAERLRPMLMEIAEMGLGSRLLLDSRAAWQAMEKHYSSLIGTMPLLDFFWAWRVLLRSLINLAQAPLPNARLYHATATGYAGLFAARAKVATQRPMLLTEHGIYTNERRIEICSADWIFESDISGYSVVNRHIELRDIWLNTFQSFSTIAYAAADAITTQYAANQTSQLNDGAPREKFRLIPNGVNFDSLPNVERLRATKDRPTILLVARIVPIKDVRTFILAAKFLAQTVPDVEAIIIGPEEEDPHYARECRELVRQSELENVVTFLGRVPDLFGYYRRADVLALTSISESQPLALLEAGATGLPAVTTDVGSCREILGLVNDDLELGPGGFVVPPGDARSFAEAAAKLLLNRELREQMGASMRDRVGKVYNQSRVRGLYADFYNEFFAHSRVI